MSLAFSEIVFWGNFIFNVSELVYLRYMRGCFLLFLKYWDIDFGIFSGYLWYVKQKEKEKGLLAWVSSNFKIK